MLKRIHKYRFRLAILVIAGLVLGIAGTYIYRQYYSSSLPSQIKRDANFSTYYPKSRASNWQPDKSTIQFDAAGQHLAYTLRHGDSSIVLSEQPTPDSFNDIPGYYAKLLDKLHQYEEFSTAVGTATLTRPDELGGGQSAVVNTSSGTLMFAHPDHDLSQTEWKAFYSELGMVVAR
jgi:hypothetical protein